MRALTKERELECPSLSIPRLYLNGFDDDAIGQMSGIRIGGRPRDKLHIGLRYVGIYVQLRCSRFRGVPVPFRDRCGRHLRMPLLRQALRSRSSPCAAHMPSLRAQMGEPGSGAEEMPQMRILFLECPCGEMRLPRLRIRMGAPQAGRPGEMPQMQIGAVEYRAAAGGPGRGRHLER